MSYAASRSYTASRAYAGSRAFTATRHVWPIPLPAVEIAGQANTPNGTTAFNTLEFSGHHLLMTALIVERSTSSHITGVTQNGVALTKISQSVGAGMTGSVWWLAGPASGDWAVTGDGVQGFEYRIDVWQGAAQSAPTAAYDAAANLAPSLSFSGVDLGIADLLALTGSPSVDSTVADQTRRQAQHGNALTRYEYDSVLLATANPQTVSYTVDSEFSTTRLYVGVAVAPF